ncbi:MAG: ATP-binding cassette domain-containing protein [Gemmataceae bacterium]
MDSLDKSLAALDRVTVNRPGGAAIFRDLSWTAHVGEAWAVVGPTGSGKTTLTDLLLGRRRPDAGTISWPRFDQPADAIRRVTFKEDSWLFSYRRHYYQQRFNFIEPQDDLSLDDFLRAGSAATGTEVYAAASRLGIDELRPLSLIKLSNGQARRARIARALLAKPRWLLLDDPFLGLDAAGRADVAELLHGLVRGGLPVLLVVRPEDVPAWVTNVLELHGENPSPGPFLKRRGENDFHPSPSASGEKGLRVRGVAAREDTPIIELQHVTVAYGGRRILHDVNWTVQAGERWAVLGPNGSGKSTLLSLLCGDHPQAYANDVRLFGQRRGSGESIWDVKRRVGFVSPEQHLYFSGALTAAQTAATGFFDVLVPRLTSAEQDEIVRSLFEQFRLTLLAGRPFSQLSTGEQRLVLLVRALVKSPPLLILDEPFQGLDRDAIGLARRWLDSHLRPDQTLLFVSHYADEIPTGVSRRLNLESGRVVEMT